jgi:hypothetical protein
VRGERVVRDDLFVFLSPTRVRATFILDAWTACSRNQAKNRPRRHRHGTAGLPIAQTGRYVVTGIEDEACLIPEFPIVARQHEGTT